MNFSLFQGKRFRLGSVYFSRNMIMVVFISQGTWSWFWLWLCAFFKENDLSCVCFSRKLIMVLCFSRNMITIVYISDFIFYSILWFSEVQFATLPANLKIFPSLPFILTLPRLLGTWEYDCLYFSRKMVNGCAYFSRKMI